MWTISKHRELQKPSGWGYPPSTSFSSPVSSIKPSSGSLGLGTSQCSPWQAGLCLGDAREGCLSSCSRPSTGGAVTNKDSSQRPAQKAQYRRQWERVENRECHLGSGDSRWQLVTVGDHWWPLVKASARWRSVVRSRHAGVVWLSISTAVGSAEGWRWWPVVCWQLPDDKIGGSV